MWSPRRLDGLVTLAVVVLGVANSFVKPSNGLLTGMPTPTIAVVSGAVGTFLWWRRRRPCTVAALVLVGHAVAFTPTALAVAMYTVGAVHYRHVRTLVLFAVAGIAADVVAEEAGWPASDWREAAFSFAFVLGPLVVGYAVAVRRDLARTARAELDSLGREQRLLAERARAEERKRIARELHDVVAHRVGHIVLTAGALQVNTAERDPDVSDAADRIRSEGRQALEELREVLGVLSPEQARRRAMRAPQPDAAQLPELVERARQVGHIVDYHVNGFPETLPASVQRAIYRVVQEALTNAAKHAPGAAVAIGVDCRLDGVHLSVRNGAPAGAPVAELAGGGNGLIGLAERVALLGGTFDAGPDGDGFRVTAVLPHHPSGPTADGP